jgi:hypothetical protein
MTKLSKILTTVTFLILLSAIYITAQNDSSALPNPTPSESEQIAVLKEQVKIMREYNQSILDTIYYALGGLVTTIAIVIGLGWYTNFRIYKNDLSNIRNELKTDFDSFKPSLREEMIEAAKKAGEAAVESSLRAIKSLQYEMLLLEAKSWEEKESFVNAIMTYTDALPLAIEIHSELYVPKLIDRILQILRSDKKLFFTAATLRAITKNLELIPQEYETDVAVIKKIIVSKREES